MPSVAVLAAALQAARRCDDFTTAVRILQSLTFKTENEGQYKAYLEELDPVLKELGECRAAERSEGPWGAGVVGAK